ncbi:MAG TPA: hypothetical protein VN704_07135 [Verrucomicrobiae bacterium]|nr:hypothetical protein [Verrucomicrobiae bacterium]
MVVNSIINTDEETKIFVGNKDNESGVKLILNLKGDMNSIIYKKEEVDNDSILIK